MRAALERVNASRMAYLAGLYRELGLSPARARDRAQVAYATFLGLLQLARQGEDQGEGERERDGGRRSPRRRRALAREVGAALLPAPRRG